MARRLGRPTRRRQLSDVRPRPPRRDAGRPAVLRRRLGRCVPSKECPATGLRGDGLAGQTCPGPGRPQPGGVGRVLDRGRNGGPSAIRGLSTSPTELPDIRQQRAAPSHLPRLSLRRRPSTRTAPRAVRRTTRRHRRAQASRCTTQVSCWPIGPVSQQCWACAPGNGCGTPSCRAERL
jgi:hypothetical protein